MGRGFRLIAQLNELRLHGAALGHGQKHSHTQAHQGLCAEDARFQPVFKGHGFGCFGQGDGRQAMCRLVHECPGPVLCMGDTLPQGEGGLHLAEEGGGGFADELQGFKGRKLLLAFPLVKAIIAQQSAFGSGLYFVSRAEGLWPEQAYFGDIEFFGHFNDTTQEAPQFVILEAGCFTQARQEEAWLREALGHMQEEVLLCFGGKFFLEQQGLQIFLQGGGERAQGGGVGFGEGLGEEGEDEEAGSVMRGRGERKQHGSLPSFACMKKASLGK